MTAKMSTASGVLPYSLGRLLVNGMAVMVNKKAKFHQTQMNGSLSRVTVEM